MASQYDDDEELLSTPNSADLAGFDSTQRRRSSNELSLLGEGFLSGGGGNMSDFLSDTANVLMPQPAAPPPASVNKSSSNSNQPKTIPGHKERIAIQHDDDDELLSTPNSADLAGFDSAQRQKSSNELSLLGEGLVSSGGGNISDFLADTANVLMPQPAAPPPPMSAKESSASSSNQSKTIPSRPPRAPPPQPSSHGSFRGAAGKPPKPAHRNAHSMGDYSFVSALTDGWSPGNDSPQERRGVSFDQNVFGEREMSESLLQPILSESGEDDMPLPQSIMTGPSPPRGIGKAPPDELPPMDEPMMGDKVSLADIVGISPLEAEAETAILRVLEEEGQDRADPDEPQHILPHLSDNAAKAFQTNPNDETKPEVHVAVPENVDHVNVDSVRSSMRASVIQLSDKPHRGSLSNRTAGTKEEAKLRKSKGLEHKLVGLTLAMNRLRAASVDHHAQVKNEPEETVESKEEEEIQTSELFAGDAMVANANMLFRRSMTRQTGNLHLNTGLAADGVQAPDHKKTDSDAVCDGGESGAEVDVEVGGVGMPIGTGDEEAGQQRKTLAQRIPGLFVKPVKRTAKRTGDDVKDFGAFLTRRKRGIVFFFCVIVFGLVLPLVGAAAVLFYAFDNPILEEGGASISWLLIFIGRHLLMVALALVSQLLIIDYLSLRRRLTVRILGAWASLGLVQSKGYPFIVVSWALYSFCMLSGKHSFAQHWLFWQDAIEMFNAQNPSGDITSNRMYLLVLGMAMFNGIVISLKRLWWGLYVGKKTYNHFGDQVAKTIEQMVLLGEVSHLSVLCARHKSKRAKVSMPFQQDFVLDRYLDDAMSRRSVGTGQLPRTKPYSEHEKIIDGTQKDRLTGRLTQSQRVRMIQLLDDWEEPEVVRHKKVRVSINAILEFRQALTFMDSDFVFSLSFGLADRRVACIESAQRVFERLLMATPGRRTLPFETIGYLATDEDEGSLDQAKMKSLIRLFRPDRDGTLTMLDFVRSCDKVYKDMRMLRASIKNAGQIDHSFELVVNWVFFFVLGIITVAVLGYDPLALFLSLSSIILAFAFMISSASSKYFEGLLFVLVRRPYDIGDRIHVSDVNSDTSAGGSSTWFVQNVDLFTTTVRFATTNEVATYSNGSLANSRIINGKRSPKAVRFVYMKFGVNVPYQKVQLFKRSVETFVKDRPREWLSLAGFRATCVEQDKGYIEYVIVLQHRESWQNIGPILNSTADVASFCLELAKKLGMRYTAPPLPVNLTMNSDNAVPPPVGSNPGDMGSPDVHALASMFEKRGDN